MEGRENKYQGGFIMFGDQLRLKPVTVGRRLRLYVLRKILCIHVNIV